MLKNYDFSRGVLYLFVFLLIVFLPLFFLSSGTSAFLVNPPESAILELGVHRYPPFYRADAVISELAVGHRSDLTSDPDEAVRRLSGAPSLTVFAVDFPAASAFAPLLSAAAAADLDEAIHDTLILTYKFHIVLSFSQPTTQSFTQAPVYIRTGSMGFPPTNGSLTVLAPSLLSAKQEGALALVGGDSRLTLAPDAAGQWSLDRPYRLLVYSEPAPAGGVAAAVGTGYGGTFLIFYLFLVVMIGLVLREWTVAGIDRLWIARLDVPQRLYRMCMGVHLCRDAGDSEHEAALVAELLDLLRSREKVLKLTTRNECL